MAPQSTSASNAGIQKARIALQDQRRTQESLADAIGSSRQVVMNFFAGKGISPGYFQDICKELKLNWQEIASLDPLSDSLSSRKTNIDVLVEQMRDLVRDDIKNRCGTMRVLDMTQPVDTNSIYTQVNILEKVMSKTRAEISQLMRGCNPEDFDRFLLGNVRQKRVDGLLAVERCKLLMILGKPGAGKTTFLKRLAMLCSNGERFESFVPIFVTLKEFAEIGEKLGLVYLIAQQFSPKFNLQNSQSLLDSGRALVLLDGLDEVQESELNRVLNEIREFARRYAQNQIIITCRIAAREYILEQFTEVEVADFNDTQIKDFVEKWFAIKDPVKSKLFIDQLKINLPVKELATNPLLLTLLCLDFEGSGYFPKSRVELYERGLNELLVKWDGRRNIKRQEVYKNLPVKRKKSLLAQLAMHTFEKGEYFFKQVTAERQISQYIENLPDTSTDPSALLVDSEAVLKSIEAHHGLLVERAIGYYSFSHLTFHEYFTAKKILEVPTEKEIVLNKILNYLTKKNWREVFLLVAEGLETADYFLQEMKQKVDKLLLDPDLQVDPDLQDFLVWVKAKSLEVQAPYKATSIRAYYFTCGLALNRDLDRALGFALTLDLDRALERALDRALDRALALNHALFLSRDRIRIDRGYDLAFALERALNIDLDLAFALDRILDLDRTNNSELAQQLNELKQSLPETSNEKREQFKIWWQANGNDWSEKLRQIMITHRNIGHDWQFTDEQKQKLQQYYDANKLLVDCLKSECYVSRSVREKIEAEMLLPIADIQVMS